MARRMPQGGMPMAAGSCNSCWTECADWKGGGLHGAEEPGIEGFVRLAEGDHPLGDAQGVPDQREIEAVDQGPVIVPTGKMSHPGGALFADPGHPV
ncbi:MAG: hypothetical protein H7835_14355 [Magnetococcus sp. XQGC-1]